MMKAEVKGNNLIVTIPLETPHPSSTGKTKIVAGSGGFKQTEAKVDGKTVSVAINATIPKD